MIRSKIFFKEFNCLVIYLCLFVCNATAQNKRPNIIYLLTDDQRWDAMGAMGNSIIKTPNMDKLANAGVLFQNAYVTTSICCVSRASILTGQYENKHHIHDFSTDLSANSIANSYPALLKKAGYSTGFIGKFGIGTHPPQQIFDYWVNSEAGEQMQPNYIIKGKSGKEIHDTDTLSNAIQNFLTDYGKGKKPFCLSVSFKAPHEQDGNPPTYVVQAPYKNLYQDVTIPEPVTADPKYWKQFPSFFQTDTNFGRARWKGLFGTPELYQENVKNYYRLITGVDDAIGKMMKKLNQLGIADNTIIMVMGDNGMFLGEHGMEGKWWGYEESVRIPLLIYNPKAPDKIKQYKAPQMALNIDIAPTILGFAGIKPPAAMEGQDLFEVLENKIPERKDFFYQYYFLGSAQLPRQEGVVTPRFKYMNYIDNNYEELFDIRFDPHETDNLAKNPKYKTELDTLRKRYQDLKKAHGVPKSEYMSSKKAF
ncbi:sulfatase [Pedobacter sp. SD-b]|uniref:Sulfatase n=1 Tax=Pedobacter segetis TaxID=2793069 RepID=A0ABS1BL32_9SPHI|nr:sulfatase [Pedobacter segetis]MBK0383599.1 sulfatase [Pedobacter segetis]